MSEKKPAKPPRLVAVDTSLEGITVKLPRRITAKQSFQLLFLFLMAVVLPLCGLGTLVAIPLLHGAGLVSLSQGLYCVSPFLFILSVIGCYRYFSEIVTIQITQRMLNIDGRSPASIPLEEVQSLEVVLNGVRGHVLVHTPTESQMVFDGLFAEELHWLAVMVQAHANRHREALQADGVNVEVPLRIPPELQSIINRK